MFGRDESGRNDTGFQRFGQALDAAVEMEDVPICAMESYRDWQPDCPTLTPTWADCSSRISSLSPVAPGRGKPHSPPISLQRRPRHRHSLGISKSGIQKQFKVERHDRAGGDPRHNHPRAADLECPDLLTIRHEQDQWNDRERKLH
jgi:hypothetical protein